MSEYTGKYKSIHDIPPEERQGTYQTVTENTWDYTDVVTYEAYVPTDAELAMVQANKKEAEEEARSAYFSVPDEAKPAIASVLYALIERTQYMGDPYPRAQFDGLRSHLSDGLFDNYTAPIEKPDGPGRVMNVNVRAVEGEGSRPNHVEMAKRSSIIEGLELMFPSDALSSYMNHFLSQPMMDRHQRMSQELQVELSSVNQKLKLFIDAIAHFSGSTNNVPFDVRRDPADDRQMLDRNHTKNPDNLHARNVASIATFIKDKPEYVTALFLWTLAMQEYCRDLKSYVREDMGENEQAILKEAPAWDTVALIEGGNREAKHFYNGTGKYSNIDRGNKLIPTVGPNSFLYFAPVVSAVMGALLEESGITHVNAGTRDINPAQYKEAFEKLSLSGIFQRGVKTMEDKPVLIRCPVSKIIGQWLTQDLGDQGRPEDQLLHRFVQKVREEIASDDWSFAKAMFHYTRDLINKRFNDAIMDREIRALEAPAALAQRRASPT